MEVVSIGIGYITMGMYLKLNLLYGSRSTTHTLGTCYRYRVYLMKCLDCLGKCWIVRIVYHTALAIGDLHLDRIVKACIWQFKDMRLTIVRRRWVGYQWLILHFSLKYRIRAIQYLYRIRRNTSCYLHTQLGMIRTWGHPVYRCGTTASIYQEGTSICI